MVYEQRILKWEIGCWSLLGLFTVVQLTLSTRFKKHLWISWIVGAVCIGNHMISSAIWNKSARVNFQRLTKLHEPVGRVQFVVFEKFTSADLSQIARDKSCDYLLIIYMQKFNFNFLHSISTFCTQFQFSALFGINWRALSQWACWNFCMYIITKETGAASVGNWNTRNWDNQTSC